MVKRALTVGFTSVAIAAALAAVTVKARSTEPVTDADSLPAYEIEIRVQEMGLNPTTQPVRSGPYYVLHARDPRGRDMRVVADAALGDILWLGPARGLNANAYAPREDVSLYDRSPRIIHVPQPGEDAVANAPSVRRITPRDDYEEVAPQPRRVAPAPQKKSNTAPARKPYSDTTPVAPPPVERRAVVTAPIHDGPSPVYPTPRFAKPSGEKFPPAPPPGYTPPSNLPPQNDLQDLPLDVPPSED